MARADVSDIRAGATPVRAQAQVVRLIPVLAAGLINGLVLVVLAVSFAALVFSGPLTGSVAAGIGLALFAMAVILLITAALSSIPAMVGSVQDFSSAVLALVAAGIADRVTAGPARFATVVVGLGVTTGLTGVFFFALGVLRLGDLVRFVPYPVVGGFLAGTGWLLTRGGLGLVASRALTLHTLDDFTTAHLAARWLPGLCFGVVLLVVSRRLRHFLAIPVALLGGIAVFYLVSAAAGQSIGGLKSGGWLLGELPRVALWKPWMVTRIGDAHWSAILAETPNIATLMIVSVLSLLLNASGIELAVNRDVDLNRELRGTGLANMAAGAGGGLVGFHALSLTALAYRMGAISRWVGACAAGVCVVALIFGASVLSLAPRPLLGGVVIFLGLGFLLEWTYDAWFRLPRADHIVVLLILISIATLGLLAGVAVGIALAVVLFVVNYSRTDVVKHTLSGATFLSRTERAGQERDLLRQLGDQITILELQGFIFFGTANGLLERIRRRGEETGTARLRFLVLDFRRVTGIDSSATLSFAKVQKLAILGGFQLICAGLPPQVRRQLERVGFRDGEANVQMFTDLDHAVEWCENRVLGEAGSEGAETRSTVAAVSDALGGPAQADRFMGYLERLEFPPGHVLIRQGEGALDVYFVESGRVTAVLSRQGGDDIRLRAMGPGTVVGEVAMYLGSVRTASVVAETPVTVYRMSRRALEEMEERDPRLAASLHRSLATLIAERLRDTLVTIEALSD